MGRAAILSQIQPTFAWLIDLEVVEPTKISVLKNIDSITS